jgi:hypothetical protein
MAKIGDGFCNVPTAGTRVQLSAGTWDAPSGPVTSIAITAKSTNTGTIVVGGPNVVAAAGSRRGTPLAAGSSVSFDTDDLQDIWIDATVNGEGVTGSFTYKAG